MTCAARSTDFQSSIAPLRLPVTFKSALRSLLTRLSNGIFESREREASRIVEAYLARTGYRFTDSIERELHERLFNGGWKSR